MRYGRLDRRITLQRRSTSLTASGQQVDAWSDLATRWASLAPASGREGFAAPQTVATELVEFQIRHSAATAGLNPGDRIIHPRGSSDATAVYDIKAVHELGRREGLRIIAERRPDIVVSAAEIDAWGASWGASWGDAWGPVA